MEKCYSEWGKISNEEISKILRQEDTSNIKKQKRNGKKKKSGVMKVRLRGAQTSELKSEETCLTMKLDEADALSDSASSLEDTKKVGTNKVVRTNRDTQQTVDFCQKYPVNSNTGQLLDFSPIFC
eukprot:11896697-Ditylum_brightwellii.AAC.1